MQMSGNSNKQAVTTCPSAGFALITGKSDFMRWGRRYDGEAHVVAGFRAQTWSPDGVRLKEEDKQGQTVMVVPLLGAMTKYGTWWSYGTSEIAAALREAAVDGNVVAVVLDIDSGGGYVNSIAPLVQAVREVRAAGKPVLAHADACYSAAYWVASQCDALFLDNPLSGCGSIGAFCELFDDREDRQTGFRWIAVYPPESKDKNLAEREALDGRTETMEKELASLVDMFRAAVLEGRPGLKKDTPGLLTGAEFRTSEALAAGLCDGMMSLADTVQAAAVRAEFGVK